MLVVADRVAVVTGANGGIGREIVRHLLGDGWRVAALDLTGDRLPAEGGAGERLLFQPCDLRVDADVDRAVAAVLMRWGRIDLLVNNAAVAPFGRFDAAGTDTGSLGETLDLNVLGCARMIAAVLPAMRRQGRGTIANMSSVLAFTGLPALAGYAASKAAVEGLSRSLALELEGSGIAVKLLHPPLTRTPASLPLGVPDLVMADPAVVARALVDRVGSRRLVVVADLRTRVWLGLARLAPGPVGRAQARFVRRPRRRGGGEPQARAGS